MSWAVSPFAGETGEEGVGETECVMSRGFVGGVGVGGKGVAVMGTRGLGQLSTVGYVEQLIGS